ncbi:carbon-nitrogen hydrolase [Colletotrichum karsti]|uniref:Carbon-nitrogen hydrolase n=1 Tax=Colletotrichum karsti TaxID=1095194 RepID=A0A9P6I5Y4_9PEZI|nr:carbon-nitrogen hydrolase [Colletotrichum karsti]KAF9874551.1 carbon-nitrogen hydrolase [Colletotrichum karsti]
MPPIRLATASPSTAPTTPQTLSQIAALARRARSHGADLLLLPEAFIGGYPRGADFGCKIGSRLPSGRDDYLDYFAKAVDLGDNVGDGGAGAGDRWVRRELPAQFADEKGYTRGDGSREELERIAAETGVFVVVGCIEKAGGSLYCSVVYVCPKLGMVGKRRKVMPTATERLVWAQGSPSTLKAVSTVIKGVRVNLAAAICWENYMPLLRQALYAQNVNLYLAPTADGRDTWLPLMRTVACEGRCFVVSSNMAVRPDGSSSSSAVADGDEAEKGDADVYAPRARRNSCLTEEGFEIALPEGKGSSAGTTTTTSSTSPQRKRRKSVIVEDGNEIVLCCDDDEPPTTNGVKTNGTAKSASAAKSASKLRSEDWISRGGSCIVGPYGDVLAGPQWEDDESLIYSDVDFEDCIRGRLDIDTAGSYSRNDSFKFSVEGLDLDPLPY